MNKLFRSLFCFLAFSSRSSSIETEERTDKVFRTPTLGRPALLGELYSAHSDLFIPGFSLWSLEKIKNGKQTVWHPSSTTDFSAEESNDHKQKKLDITAHIAGSFEGGFITVEGSASYLKESDDTDETASVTLSFMSITRTESLASNLLIEANKSPMCKDDNWEKHFTDKTSQPTHVVASVTFGGNCHLVYSKTLKEGDDKLEITGALKVHVQGGAFSIDASATLGLTNYDDNTFDNLKVTMHSDFLLEKQPLTFNDTMKIYRDISQNFGTKDSLYNQSVPMFVTLIPIASYCVNIDSNATEIGKDILKRATNVRLTLMKVLDKISKLLTSRAALGNFAVMELLLGFQSDVSNYTLFYEAELQKLIIGARNPAIKEIQDSNLVQLIKKYTNSPYNYNKHLYNYLSQRTRQVNALNIFYTQTVSQNEPQIAVYTKADVPVALITEPVLFLLKLYVLPDVSEYKYTKWTDKDEDARWYSNSNEATVGDIGNMWRDFRTFFHLNGYQEGQNFFVLLEAENSVEIKDKNITMMLELYIDGFKTNPEFQLRDLLKLATNPQVCRTSQGKELTINVNNPPSLPTPNTILQVLVSLTKKTSLFTAHPESTSHYTQTIDDTSLTIPNLVPEYTYNVTVAYVTEYGSLTPSKVFTIIGIFDKMMETVGCQISRNLMQENITHIYQGFIPKTTSSDCAHACHISHNCSIGWTFQLSTGNCYFNKAGTNTTHMNGWAIGTQSCDAVEMIEEDCSESVLFLDAYNIFDLPSFQKRDCSVLPYPGDNYGSGSVSGMMNGNLITCGGEGTNSLYYNNCSSLENGIWVKKLEMHESRENAAASPLPANHNGLMITGGYGSNGEIGENENLYLSTTEILTTGQRSYGPPMPRRVMQHCQVTLGSTVIVTGGNGEFPVAPTTLNKTIFLGEDNQWQDLPDMNQGRFAHSCAILDNTVYVMGGSGQTAEKYKLGWNNWKQIEDVPLSMGWAQPAFVYEDILYIITDNGTVYKLKEGQSWDLVANVTRSANEHMQTWPSQVLPASSVGC